MKLDIQNLSVSYDEDFVLRNLSLQLHAGEFFSLLGPSGCGKTTLMKAIAGILPARTGTIHLDGEDITRLGIHRRGCVIVFQDMRLFPHQSVEENVAFPLKMQGMPKKERLALAREFLKKVHMESFAHRYPAALSGGQQQRVALARALAARPRLLLLDEPFSALDENLREDMRALVLSLRKEFDMTVLMVTHDREEALSMSDRVCLMFDGQLVQTGTPREVYTRPVNRQAADYFGNCVYIPGQVKDGFFTAPAVRCPAQYPDGSYTLMVRPDALRTDVPGDYPLMVDSVLYRGSDTLVSFRAPDGTLWKKAYTAAVSFAPGDSLQASLDICEPVLYSR